MRMRHYGNRSYPDPTTHELHDLALYLMTRPDLSNADIGEVEAALKKAGVLHTDQDHFYTAMHAMMRLQTLKRQAREAATA